jgi:type IV pilus assembly protein PilC
MLVVNISDFIRDPMGGGLMVLLFIAGISFLKYRIRSSLEFRMKWHRVILKLPLIGEMTLKANLAQIAMVYGNLTDAGVPVIEALDITADSTKNEVLRDAIQAAKRGVFSGDPLSKIFREIPIIPNAFSQLISVGEQTGNMNEMLETISTYYEEEFDGTVEKLSQLMEPIMICFLGGVIGFILIAMYLPIFKMGQVVTG